MSEESRLVEGEEVGSLGKNESEEEKEEEEKELSVGKPEIEKSVECELMSPDRNVATSQNEHKYLGSASSSMPLMCYRPRGVFVDYWLLSHPPPHYL